MRWSPGYGVCLTPQTAPTSVARLPPMRLLHLVLPCALGLRWFPLDAAAPATSGTAGARAMALYPLPALYLPGSTCLVRNVQLRNIAMCKEEKEFAAALVSLDDAQNAQCSRVCSVLRVDEIQPAQRDASGKVLAASVQSSVQLVQCTVVGRVQIVGCQNPEAWRDPRKEEYLVAEVLAYDDEPVSGGAIDGAAAAAAEAVAEAAAADFYRLGDALLETAEEEEGFDVDAAVASLEQAAELTVAV